MKYTKQQKQHKKKGENITQQREQSLQKQKTGELPNKLKSMPENKIVIHSSNYVVDYNKCEQTKSQQVKSKDEHIGF